MPDTTKLILGIVLAIVVIALIIWLFASARRREAEARRLEAEAVRAKLAERIPVVQEREDRASVTARIAEEARREAEAVAAQAARLEREAAEHRAEAQAARSEQDELARLADRIDPDVRTDDEGHRVDESDRRLTGGSPVASALGMSALAQDDDEPDLADHENPFATQTATPSPGPTPPDSSVQNLRAGEGAVGDPDWVNGPVDEDAADEVEAQAARDAQEADWINGPDDEAAAASAHSTSAESSAQDLPLGAAGLGAEGAESEHSTSDSSVQNVRSDTADAADPDWVNSPVDEDAADEVEGSRLGEQSRRRGRRRRGGGPGCPRLPGGRLDQRPRRRGGSSFCTLDVN